jgi:hypothetical protein
MLGYPLELKKSLAVRGGWNESVAIGRRINSPKTTTLKSSCPSKIEAAESVSGPGFST